MGHSGYMFLRAFKRPQTCRIFEKGIMPQDLMCNLIDNLCIGLFKCLSFRILKRKADHWILSHPRRIFFSCIHNL